MRKITVGKPFPMGATLIGPGKVQFVTRAMAGRQSGLIIYHGKSRKKEIIPLTEEFRIGNIYSVIIDNLKTDKISYNFLENGREVTDPYARVIYGNEGWGKGKYDSLSGGISPRDYPWEEDMPVRREYEDSIFYQLHVRGFTRHSSSQVKAKGTFEGICEKVGYLKELGITAIELLPAYEFLEVEEDSRVPQDMEEARKNCGIACTGRNKRINYWGFKEGYYFAPKASYSALKDPGWSFKAMVQGLHREGIEVIMQFYFPHTVSRSFMIEVIRYWAEEYHIDGARLMGVDIPVELMATMPELANFKLLYESFHENEVYRYQQIPFYKNLAHYNDGYMYSMRKFLKGDVGSLQQGFHEMMNGGGRIRRIVYLTNYNTFTLKDLVSYDRKHNEDNGEGGNDGSNYNVSWNCGAEGSTRKKNILQLRRQQMKNALALLLLSKSTPVILAGDEFGNSQNGNNNPYCQDNALSWLNWKDLEKNREQFEFCKSMISLIKQEALYKRQNDNGKEREAADYPCLSYHGREAWKLDWSAGNEESGGILYYGDNKYIYIGINMHWKESWLALPNLPLGSQWEVVFDTSEKEGKEREAVGKKRLSMDARSIKVVMAKRKVNKNDNKSTQAF